MDIQESPLAKLVRKGPEALSDTELLAVIFKTPLGKAASMVADAPLPLDNAATKSPRMAALDEYAKRGKPDPRPIVDSARSVAGLIPEATRKAQKEHFLILCLNARRQLVHMETVSIGTLSASLVHPREVFQPAIKYSAAAVVAVHNHPSGDTTPSSEDRDVTRRLQRAGEILGIPLADHVIVSESGFFSFREHGIL
jgi:DNA repair protein RadC